MNSSSRLFDISHQQITDTIDMYIHVYIMRTVERIFKAEHPRIVYKFLELAASVVSMKLYNTEIDSHYAKKDTTEFKEIRDLFIGIGKYTHGLLEKNDPLIDSLRKMNNKFTIEEYNKLISTRICNFLTTNTLPRLKAHSDYNRPQL